MPQVKYPCPDVCWAKGVEKWDFWTAFARFAKRDSSLEKSWEDKRWFCLARTDQIPAFGSRLDCSLSISLKISFFFEFKNWKHIKSSHSTHKQNAVMQQLVGGLLMARLRIVNNCSSSRSSNFAYQKKVGEMGAKLFRECGNHPKRAPLSVSCEWNGNDEFVWIPPTFLSDGLLCWGGKSVKK